MQESKKQITLIFILIVITPIILLLSRQVLPNNYLASSIYKIIFLSPLLYRFFIERKTFKQSLSENFSIKKFKENAYLMLFIGVILALIYISSFFIFRDYLDLENISEKLNQLISLNVNNLIFIGLYIIFINSLLEEFFWRGFIFEKLDKLINTKKAYFFSAVAFSFHHVMFYYDWFNITFFLLVTLGLIIYAAIMNFIFAKYRDLFSCWLVHIIVDIVQIFIAFKLFVI